MIEWEKIVITLIKLNFYEADTGSGLWLTGWKEHVKLTLEELTGVKDKEVLSYIKKKLDETEQP